MQHNYLANVCQINNVNHESKKQTKKKRSQRALSLSVNGPHLPSVLNDPLNLKIAGMFTVDFPGTVGCTEL